MSRYMKTESVKIAVAKEFDRLHATIDTLEERLELAQFRYEMSKVRCAKLITSMRGPHEIR